MKYKEWTKINWDGNTSLGYKCFRKTFGRGNVSVGIGDFYHIVYSYGNNSEDSMSGTRWRKSGVMTEKEAMCMVDRNNGKYNYLDNEPNK